MYGEIGLTGTLKIGASCTHNLYGKVFELRLGWWELRINGAKMSKTSDLSGDCLHGGWANPAISRLKTAYHRVNILAKMEEPLRRNPVMRILEFGPGLGCLIELVHAKWSSVEYHVADIDRQVLDALVEKFPFVTPHHLEKSVDLADVQGAFDVIVAVDVWEHLPLSEALAYTTWCWQRLRPGGMLILQTPNWGCPVTPANFYGDLTHRTPLNEESIRQLFRGAGIPEGAFSVLPRKTPGVLGFIRDRLNGLFGLFYRLVLVFFGAVRLKIFSPDLVAIVRKGVPEASSE